MDISQATVGRAIDILRVGPMRADEFARRMYPDRCADRTPGQQSQMGHGLLHPMARIGYVQRISDLWVLKTARTPEVPESSGSQTGSQTGVELGVGQPVQLGVGPGDGQLDPLPERLANEPPRNEAERRADLRRLHQLVSLADQPVATVTHDAALGDLALRGEPLSDCFAEACAWVVLAGREMNVYLPGNDAPMIVGIRPIEAARALHVRWQQSATPPELPHYEGWILGDDGPMADPTCWRPVGVVDDDQWLCALESFERRIHRQRAAAGLA